MSSVSVDFIAERETASAWDGHSELRTATTESFNLGPSVGAGPRGKEEVFIHKL